MDNNLTSQTFRVVAHMKTPALIHGDLPLESLLAACVYNESGAMREDALKQVPIDFMDTPEGKIWLASAAMFDGHLKQTEHIVVRGRHFSEMGPAFYEPNPRARKDGWAVDQGTGPYKRLMTPYTVYEVSRLVWYATGNIKRCKDLLKTQGWIGKRRGSGFGEVSEYEVLPWTGNPVVDTRGMVRRPVALRKLGYLEGALPRGRQRVINTVDSHPAWLHDQELCAVPPVRVEPREQPIAEDGGEMFFEQ